MLITGKLTFAAAVAIKLTDATVVAGKLRPCLPKVVPKQLNCKPDDVSVVNVIMVWLLQHIFLTNEALILVQKMSHK